MSKQEFNPLDLLPKEEIKIVLKQHSKRELLGKALAWELIARQYKEQLNELQDDDTTETTPSETDS